ncbi:hypothetical protein KI387_042476, partial [Taxus chinensis]
MHEKEGKIQKLPSKEDCTRGNLEEDVALEQQNQRSTGVLAGWTREDAKANPMDGAIWKHPWLKKFPLLLADGFSMMTSRFHFFNKFTSGYEVFGDRSSGGNCELRACGELPGCGTTPLSEGPAGLDEGGNAFSSEKLLEEFLLHLAPVHNWGDCHEASLWRGGVFQVPYEISGKDREAKIKNVKLKCPSFGWCKFNVRKGSAGGGGIFRDHKGDCLRAYVGQVGLHSNNHAEAITMLWGLKLCETLNIQNLIIEGDSMIIMGGDRVRTKPTAYMHLKRDCTLWRLLRKGGLSIYIEKVQGHDPQLANKLGKVWEDNCEIEVNENTIAKATGRILIPAGFADILCDLKKRDFPREESAGNTERARDTIDLEARILRVDAVEDTILVVNKNLVQEVEFTTSEQDLGRITLLLSGYVRAHSLSVNQLVHVPGAGDYRLNQIDILEDPFPLNQRQKDKGDSMQLDDNSQSQKVIRSLLPNTLEQELIVVENVPDPLAGEQTWPTKEELAEADKNSGQKKLKKRALPRGMSDYQAAWIVDETDDENDTDDGSEPEDDMELDRQEQKDNCLEETNKFEEASVAGDHASVSFTLRDYDEETQTDFMADDDNFTQEEMQAEIQRLKEAHARDEEFPDEVETPIDVPARQRFARYRGLKSFRSSTWDPKESLPEEYARIFAFDNFARTHKHVLAKAKEIDSGKLDGCASIGAYVRLHIDGVPIDVATKLLHGYKKRPVIAFGLFQHETKMSVLHF